MNEKAEGQETISNIFQKMVSARKVFWVSAGMTEPDHTYLMVGTYNTTVNASDND